MAPRKHVIDRLADQLVGGHVGETVRLGVTATEDVEMRGIVPELVAAVRGRGSELAFVSPSTDEQRRITGFGPERDGDEALFVGADRPSWATMLIDVPGPGELDLFRIGGAADAEVHLFSYGTLQQPEVQQANYGRHLPGAADTLAGHRLDWVTITDPAVLATSGAERHPVVSPSTDPADQVEGTVFTLTTAELAASDLYEVADYRRSRVQLASGTGAWVYLAA